MSEARQRLPEDLELMAPGPGLAAALAAVDRRTLSERDRVRLVRARNRLVSHVQAELLADLYAVTWDEPPDDGMVPPEAGQYPWAEAEVAFVLAWTGTATGRRMEQARQLVEDLPQVRAALRAGDIDMPKALVIGELAGWLADPAEARQLVDRVLQEASRLTTGQLRVRLRRLVLAVDPEAARRRCAAMVRSRRVESFGNPDGSGELWGRGLAPQDAAAAWERLTAIATAARAGGDSRSMDQLRADAMLDLLGGEGVAVGGPVSRHTAGLPEAEGLPDAGQEVGDAPGTQAGRPGPVGSSEPATTPVSRVGSPVATSRGVLPGPRRGVVELQVPLATLLRLSDHPGELAGFGPVVADIARQVAERQRAATWRFSVHDTVGDLVHHGITDQRPTTARSPSPRPQTKPPPARQKTTGREVTGTTGREVTGTTGNTTTTTTTTTTTGREAVGPETTGTTITGHGITGTTITGHGITGTTITGDDTTSDTTTTTGRRPAAQVAAFVRARDRTCVAPGCRRPARTCDIDHTVDWARGGLTEPANLGLLCRRHHRFKHAPGTDLVQFTPGTFGWTTPRGMQYVTRPQPPLLDDP